MILASVSFVGLVICVYILLFRMWKTSKGRRGLRAFIIATALVEAYLLYWMGQLLLSAVSGH